MFVVVMMYLSDLKASSMAAAVPSAEDKVSQSHSGDDNDSAKRRVQDDEQALYTLLQSDFNVDEAVRRKKLQNIPPSGESFCD